MPAHDADPAPGSPPAIQTTTTRRGDQAVTVAAFEQETAPNGLLMGAGRIVVGFKPGSTPSAQTDASRAAGAMTTEAIGSSGMIAAQVSAGTTASALAAYRSRADVAWAEPDYARQATVIPNDPLFGQQSVPRHIGAPIAWDVTTGSPAVRIAILDCGIFSAS